MKNRQTTLLDIVLALHGAIYWNVLLYTGQTTVASYPGTAQHFIPPDFVLRMHWSRILETKIRLCTHKQAQHFIIFLLRPCCSCYTRLGTAVGLKLRKPKPCPCRDIFLFGTRKIRRICSLVILLSDSFCLAKVFLYNPRTL